MKLYHGRKVNLQASDARVPFHGAFARHETRVRGFYPDPPDPHISLPFRRPFWMHKVKKSAIKALIRAYDDAENGTRKLSRLHGAGNIQRRISIPVGMGKGFRRLSSNLGSTGVGGGGGGHHRSGERPAGEPGA